MYCHESETDTCSSSPDVFWVMAVVVVVLFLNRNDFVALFLSENVILFFFIQKMYRPECEHGTDVVCMLNSENELLCTNFDQFLFQNIFSQFSLTF